MLEEKNARNSGRTGRGRSRRRTASRRRKKRGAAVLFGVLLLGAVCLTGTAVVLHLTGSPGEETASGMTIRPETFPQTPEEDG